MAYINYRDLLNLDSEVSSHGIITLKKPLSLSLFKGNDAAFQTKGWSDVKLVIYMTTHLSPLHIKFFQCWRDAIQRMEIFQYADLILYIPYSSTYNAKTIRKQLPFRNQIIIKHY
jgi:hypothetical protein